MQADLLLDLLKGLLNLPDLVILAVVLICMVLGFRRGFFGSCLLYTSPSPRD